MNKKVVLSVLSTAVVASLATSAFAAPSAGLYIGGNVDKYYSLTDFVNNEVSARGEINSVGLDNVLYIDSKGNGATVKKVALADSLNDALTKVTLGDFAGNVYKNAKTGEIYDPSKDPDVTGLPTGDLQVASVKSINAAQVEVKFSADVEKKSAEDKGNYTVEGYTGDIVPTLVDSKTVVLTLKELDKTAALNQETKTVTAKDIKSASDANKTIPAFSGKVTFMDLTIPQAVSAKLVAPGTVQISFSEPVTVADSSAFLLDGGKYSVTDKQEDAVTKSITIKTGSLSVGEHTISINDNGTVKVKDGAGLNVAKAELKFTVSNDTTPPALTTAVANSQYEVVLTFDESIQELKPEFVYHTADTDAYQGLKAEPVVGTDNKQWTVTFKNPLPTGTVAIKVAKEAVQDNFGNKNSEILSANVNITADTVKPTVSELKLVDASTVTLTFSEEVTGAGDKANYKITDKDGKAVGFSVTYDKKKATIKFSTALKEGATYNVEVTGVKDKAVIPNVMDKYTSAFTVADTTAPTVNDQGIYDAENHKITIFFSEAMNGQDLLDKSKYTLETSDGVQVALPGDATVAVGPNNSSVNITLPAVVKDKAGKDITDKISKIIVAQLRDLAENKTKAFSTVTVAANTAGEIKAESAKTVDTKTVVLTLDKPLKSIAASDFTVGGQNAEFANYENKTLDSGVFGSEVTLKVAEALATDAKPVVAVKDNAKTVSIYGDKLAKGNLTTAEDGVAPVLADVIEDNKIDGKDLQFTLDDQDKVAKITVTFSEALKSGTVSIDDFQVDGHSIGNVSLDDNRTGVVIELAKAGNNDELYTVRFVGAVSDTNGNVFEGKGVALENGVVTVPNAAPTIELAEGVEATQTVEVNDPEPTVATTDVAVADKEDAAADLKVTYEITKKSDGSKVEAIKTDAEEEYTVTYTVTDSANATAKVTRTITVVTPTP